MKVLAKRSKVDEKKSARLAKVSGSRGSGSSKWPLGADIMPAKSTKLSKGTIPHAVAWVAVARIMPETCILEVSTGAGGAKGSERRLGYKTMPRAKIAPSTKKHLVPAIEALATLSSDGTEDSSPHDRVPEVQSKANPRGSSSEHQARSTIKLGP
jgi:hypothetical protein